MRRYPCSRVSATVLGLLILLILTSSSRAAVPATPAAVDGLLYSREFRLETSYRYDWSAERPQVTQGRLIVIQADPELVRPRQMAEPVLYVGATPAHCINVGYPSGRVIAIVPGEIDLEHEPIWFGAPALPERVDADHALRERRLAIAAGIEPFAPRLVAVAQERGGELLVVDNIETLLLHAAALIDRHAPSEQGRVAALRARPGSWTLRQLPTPSH